MRTLCGTILAAAAAFGAAVVAEVPKNGKSETRGVLCLTFDDSHFDDWEAVTNCGFRRTVSHFL